MTTIDANKIAVLDSEMAEATEIIAEMTLVMGKMWKHIEALHARVQALESRLP